ncbi:unannotated protein [freshwater metagenome]|uniref:Unannotated protein n=1 Tax=freshwater metagenome TaxID=449393 RepID=A0A6J7BSM0_9ZZZZ|nr:PucR family transcriptional regulator [Actinomycetota bacterium]
MPPRLRDVIAISDLGLTVQARVSTRVARATASGVHGPGALDAPVRWVAVSELDDPAPFLDGGELLLTTGMRLPKSSAGCTAYVNRLVAAGVVGLGLGVGLTHPSAPDALVAAAEKAGLILLEVPERTPFIAISKAVSRLLAAEEYQEAARGFAAQRDLIRAALGADDGDGAAVLVRLAKHSGRFAMMLDAAGHVLHASPASAAGRAVDLGPEIARLRPKGLLAAAVVAGVDEYVVIQPLGVKGRARGFLVVGAPGPLSASDQAVVNLTVSLLSSTLTRGGGTTAAERGVRAAALALVLDGHAGRLPWAALGWLPLHERLVRILLARPSGSDAASIAAAEDRLTEALPGVAVASGLVAHDRSLVLAMAPADSLLEAASVAAGSDAIAGIGIGDGAHVDDPVSLARSLARARRALEVVIGSGVASTGAAGERLVPVLSYDALGGGLESLLDPAAADDWAAALLAPLDQPGERADLAATLLAWLTRHGQIDAAAADLGVHRHTVRHRIQRAEILLDRSLDDPGVRVELYLALTRRTA